MPTLIDCMKRAMKTVSSSFDCFILTSFSQDCKGFKVNECQDMLLNRSENILKRKYFVFDELDGTIKIINLSPIDIEFIAMDSQRLLKTNSNHCILNKSEVREDRAASTILGNSSWTIRHVSEENSLDQGVFVMAMPCSFSSFNADNNPSDNNDNFHSAVVVVLRKSVEYDEGDEICMAYLAKVFSWSVDILLNPTFGGSSRIIKGLEGERNALHQQLLHQIKRDEEEQNDAQSGTDRNKVTKYPEYIAAMHQLCSDLIEVPNSKNQLLDDSLPLSWLGRLVPSAVEVNVDEMQSAKTRQGERFWSVFTPTTTDELLAKNIASECAKFAFGASRVLDVWSSSENRSFGEELCRDTFLFLDVENSKERRNKDTLTIGSFKLLYWEEREHVVEFFNSSKETSGEDSSPKGTEHLKAVLISPQFSKDPIWFKFSISKDEIPETYKIKMILLVRSIITKELELKKIREAFQMMHDNQCANVRKFNEDIAYVQQSFDDLKIQEQLKYANFQKDIETKTKKQVESMETLSHKCKTIVKDCLKEKKKSLSFVMRISYTANYILTYHANESNRKKKKLSLSKLLRQVSAIMAPIMETSAAFVQQDKHPHQKSVDGGLEIKPHLSLTWITGATQWIGSTDAQVTVGDKTYQSNNPILVAQKTKQIIIVAHTDDAIEKLKGQKDFQMMQKRELNDYFVAAQEGNDYSFVISSFFPEKTLIIPVTLQHRNEEIVIVVKPEPEVTGSDVNSRLDSTSISLPFTLACWIFVKQCLISCVYRCDLETENESIKHDKASNYFALFMKKRFSVTSLRRKAHAFNHLKEVIRNYRSADLRRKYSEERAKVLRLHEHLRELERSVADWTELTKGFNRASSGIGDGLPGLWGEASRPLVQLITPHVILDGCGLLVATPDGEVLDLSVVELAPPDYDRTFLNQSNQQGLRLTDLNDDMAPADIKIQPASELGTNVKSLAWNILSSMGGDGSGVQRLWKLTKNSSGRSREQFEEQMWLVPVRTAGEVFGILRVAVRVPFITGLKHSKTVYFNSSSKSQQGGDTKSDDFDSYDEEDSVNYTKNLLSPPETTHRSSTAKKNSDVNSVESAKRNLIHFAEIMAPLVAAARQLDSAKSLERKLHDNMSAMERSHSDIQQKLSSNVDRLNVLSQCITMVGHAVGENLAEDDFELNVLEVLRRRLKGPLESLLPAVSVNFITAIDNEREGGNLSFAHHNRNIVTLEEPVIVINPGEDFLNEIQQIYLQITFQNDRNSHEENMDMKSTLQLLLPPLAAVTSGFYSSMTREITAKRKVSTAVENLHTLKHQHEDLVLLKNSISYKEIVASHTSEFNRKLVGIMEACILCSAEHSLLNSDSSGERDGPISIPASNFLRGLSSKFATLFKASECKFSFGVQQKPFGDVDENLSSSEDKKNISLMWYSEEVDSPTRLLINDETTQISVNLAAACITKNMKSCVEVGVDSSDENIEPNLDEVARKDNEVKILTVPIVTPILSNSSSMNQTSVHTKPIVIGVVQVLLGLPCEDFHEINDFCETMSHTVGVVLSHDIRRLALLQSHSDLISANYILQKSINDLSSEADVVRRQTNVWQAVMTCVNQTIHGCEVNANKDEFLSNILKATEAIHPMGIMLSLSAGESEDIVIPSDYENVGRVALSCNGLRSDVNSSQEVLHILLDKKKYLCDTVDVRLYNVILDNLLAFFGSLDKFVNIKIQMSLRAAAEIQKLNRKNEKLRTDREKVTKKLVETVEECNLMADKISSFKEKKISEAQRVDALNVSFSTSVTSFVHSLRSSVMNIFQDLPGGGDLPKSLNFPVETTELLFCKFSQIVEESLSEAKTSLVHYGTKEGFDNAMHVSVLVTNRKSSANVAEDSTQRKFFNIDSNMVMFEGNKPHGVPIRRNLERNSKNKSAISKCFRTGVVQIAKRVKNKKTYDAISEESSNASSELLSDDLEGVSPLISIAKSVIMIVIPLHTCVADLLSVVRVAIEIDSSNDYGDDNHGDLSRQSNIIRAIAELISSLGLPVSRLYHHNNELLQLGVKSLRDNEKHGETIKQAQNQITKFRKLYKIVCRESSTLMDPPIAALISHSEVNPLTNHPASLTPLVALQDTSMKVLSMVRNLLKSEGQALLLRNSNSNPSSFQLIYTGNALSWPGIEQGTFGMVTGSHKTTSDKSKHDASSLVESVMVSHKPLDLKNVHDDPRYCSSIDGLCVKGTPMLIVPVRGRSGGVVGVLLAAREQDATSFSVDDVVACDLVSAFSSISLYWGQGLGYIHEKLTRSMAKMESLELSVSAMQKH